LEVPIDESVNEKDLVWGEQVSRFSTVLGEKEAGGFRLGGFDPK